MNTTRLAIMCGCLALIAGCAKEPPPRTVADFLDNRILLEATMVRCGENRNVSKYEAECVNAREAINRIAAEEQRAQRAALEAESARKRKALRRTQEAAAKARRLAAEAQRRQEEAQYLGVFENPPPAESGEVNPKPQLPAVPIPQAEPETAAETPPVGEATDLESVREELKRRQETSP